MKYIVFCKFKGSYSFGETKFKKRTIKGQFYIPYGVPNNFALASTILVHAVHTKAKWAITSLYSHPIIFYIYM